MVLFLLYLCSERFSFKRPQQPLIHYYYDKKIAQRVATLEELPVGGRSFFFGGLRLVDDKKKRIEKKQDMLQLGLEDVDWILLLITCTHAKNTFVLYVHMYTCCTCTSYTHIHTHGQQLLYKTEKWLRVAGQPASKMTGGAFSNWHPTE